MIANRQSIEKYMTYMYTEYESSRLSGGLMQLERLKEWRESQGLTQRELAGKAEVGEVTIARVETGSSIRPNTARKIAEALGRNVADLLGRPPTPAEPSLSKGEVSSQPEVEGPKSSQAEEQRTLEEVLQEVVGTHYLALPPEELEDMYEEASFEEAREITRQTFAEQRVINEFLKEHDRTEISGQWVTRSQTNRWVSLEGIQKAAQREIDRAREAGDKEYAEKIRTGYGLAVEETLGIA
jgi:transcriptional regulator with XRE-family HTH domain